MAAQKKEGEINLLPQDEFEKTTLGRTLKWALSTFRIIVIITEMVVMLAFLSRFWLDARSNDLNELITQNQAVISASSDFETQFRDTQRKLKIFSSLTKEETPISQTLSTITGLLPPDVLLSSFSFIEDSIQIKGVAGGERGIAQFIANLDAKDEFEKIELVNANTSPEEESTVIFTLKITLKKGGK